MKTIENSQRPLKLLAAIAIAIAGGAAACAAPADVPEGDEPGSSDVRVQADPSVDIERAPVDMGDTICGQSCRITCGGSSCSASAPSGKEVCCYCTGTTPTCG